MNKLRFCAFVVLLLLDGSRTAFSLPDQQSEPFDTYAQSISWSSETTRLENLAYYLKRFPDHVVFIGFWVGDNDSKKTVKARATRARRYLITKLRIDPDRVRLICSGRLDRSRTTYYVVGETEPPPEFKEPC